jgi:flagellar FliL protein
MNSIRLIVLSHRGLLALLLLALAFGAMAEDEEEEKAPPAKPVYVELPSVVSNLSQGAKHIRLSTQLLLTSDAVQETVKSYSPVMLNEMLLVISDQDGAALKTPAGKESFRKAALAALNEKLKEMTGLEDDPIKDLFFTAYFVR